jgi:hypothetical protein
VQCVLWALSSARVRWLQDVQQAHADRKRQAGCTLTSRLATRSFITASCEASRFSVPARRLLNPLSEVASACSRSVTVRSSRVWPWVTYNEEVRSGDCISEYKCSTLECH